MCGRSEARWDQKLKGITGRYTRIKTKGGIRDIIMNNCALLGTQRITHYFPGTDMFRKLKTTAITKCNWVILMPYSPPDDNHSR